QGRGIHGFQASSNFRRDHADSPTLLGGGVFFAPPAISRRPPEQTDNSSRKPLTSRDFYGVLPVTPAIGGDKGETQGHERDGNAAKGTAEEGIVPTARWR